MNVCWFGEADFKECTLAGMGAEENLRASMGTRSSSYLVEELKDGVTQVRS